MSEETETVEPPIEEAVAEDVVDPIDEIERDLKNFRETSSTHNVEEEPEEEPEPEEFIPEDESDLNLVEEFKVKMFLGFCFTLLDGFHVWVYKYISKHDIKDEEMSLTEKEQEALMSYFKTKRVLEIINKIPPEIVGIIHMEYMYYRRYRKLVKEKEAEEEKQAEIKKKLLIEAALKIKKRRETKRAPIKKAVKKKESVKKPLVKKKKAKKKEPIQKT